MRSIVTGAARGLGEGVAARLLAEGGRVALLDRSDDVRQVAAALQEEHPEGHAVAAVGDVTDEPWVEGAVADLVRRLGGLDLLVNNAGIGGPSTPVVDTPVQGFRQVLDVNVVGAFLMARACARVMIAAGEGGTIVNLGSIFGQQGVGNGASYSASKGGIALLTHSLALELAPHAIRVNTIAPGNMRTEMHLADLRVAAGINGTTLEHEERRVRATIPLGRHGTGADVGGAVVWLASSDASYVTGQTIGVNGGVMLT